MSAAVFEHSVPWTEAEFLALGETSDRVELFDGSLYVTPAPSVGHQSISTSLLFALTPPATEAGLRVYPAVNVRLKPDRIPIPDLVISEPVDAGQLVVDARLVRLVCEIVSPRNAATDRVLKMHYHAEAAIPHYLLVEQDPLWLRLFRLDGEHYVVQAEAGAGNVSRLEEPVRVEIDPASLG